jgi:hypothetical protein
VASLSFSPKTFYISRDAELAIFKTSQEAEDWITDGDYSGNPTIFVRANKLFFVVSTINHNIKGRNRGVIQLIHDDVIGYAGYKHCWTGFKPFNLTPG